MAQGKNITGLTDLLLKYISEPDPILFSMLEYLYKQLMEAEVPGIVRTEKNVHDPSRSDYCCRMDFGHSFPRRRYPDTSAPMRQVQLHSSMDSIRSGSTIHLSNYFENLCYFFSESLVSLLFKYVDTIHFIRVPMTFLCIYEIVNFIVLYLSSGVK